MVQNRDQWRIKPSTFSIQGDSGGKVNILGGDSIGHCETEVHMYIKHVIVQLMHTNYKIIRSLEQLKL
jgi:hypothetical protein